ncbi:FAD-binding domain-containing protein [Aquimarina longa]|uniref:FAD-binding domain-containing protein n=1 Tax=Aquimarina longa TaxID=1080221 RepID=UPI000785E42E|nr:FAD-binding domain-containing protein [Aquimarina longa]
MELFENELSIFPTDYKEVLQRVNTSKPVKYCATRNYINGAVTYLSPYISRGVISTKYILTEILNKGFNPSKIEKFIQELAWRDYWQQLWVVKKDAINSDIKHQQSKVAHTAIPKSILDANTGIEAIDNAIKTFYTTGYIHNHLRMYIASIVCNVGQSYWKAPAQWMYYHLLDADWASNALSWQWVAGTNSNKKYYANQENINKYCFSNQKKTFLDVNYDVFKDLGIPKKLIPTTALQLETPLPPRKGISINKTLPTYIYNFYNLDPIWKKNSIANRVLLLEPSVFKQYPIAQKSIDFMIAISKNISNIQIYVGEFNALVSEYELKTIYYKEHPLNTHYKGYEESRDWMFDVQGYYPSFFAFWKKCKKQLHY